MFTRPLGQGATPGPKSGWIAQFRFLADAEGLSSAAGRHPDSDLLPVINASYKALREFVTGLGYTQFITRGTTTNLPTTPVEVGENYAIIATTVGLNQVKKIDVKFSGTDWYELPEVTLLQLRDVAPARHFGTTPNRPQAWCWLDAGAVTLPSTFVAGRIALCPVPSSGQYCLWSTTEIVDVAVAADVFLYHTEDWAQWHMFDVMSKICGARDKDTARKLDYILNNRLNIEVPGSPANNIYKQRPTAAGPRTWVRSASYRGPAPWR